MKIFKGLKFLLCLAFAFIFMFGNALFINAATEFKETVKLRAQYKLDYKIISFVGAITYNCIDPYQDKKITSVDNISLGVGDCWGETFDFKQQSVDFLGISENGKIVYAFVCGELAEHIENVDYVYHIKVPVVYSIDR